MSARPTPGEVAQTPTFLLTLLGSAAVTLWLTRRGPGADLVAFFTLGLAGWGGITLAAGLEVKRDEQVWGWRVLARSLRRPSPHFLVGFLTHLPMALASTLIALSWWETTRRRDRGVKNAPTGG